MNRLSPKALPVDNLTRGFLEEIRDHNVVNVIEFKRHADDPQDEVPGLGFGVCLVICAELWVALFEVYWLLRIYL